MYVVALHALQARNAVADGVHAHVSNVQLACNTTPCKVSYIPCKEERYGHTYRTGRVWEHGQTVEALAVRSIRHHWRGRPGGLRSPALLPLGLDGLPGMSRSATSAAIGDGREAASGRPKRARHASTQHPNRSDGWNELLAAQAAHKTRRQVVCTTLFHT